MRPFVLVTPAAFLKSTAANHLCHANPGQVLSQPCITAGWWFKPDFIINELNINSAITSPAHDEIVPLGTRTSYTIVGYAYTGVQRHNQ